MLRELNSVIPGDKHSLRSRVLLWFYPNRGWKSDSHSARRARPAKGPGGGAAQSSSPHREETGHAV